MKRRFFGSRTSRKTRQDSLRSVQGSTLPLRQRLDLKGELALAAAPTLIILIVLAFVEVLSRQRLLFASLASSAFLIYLDPQHGTNTVRTLVSSQMMAATIGVVTYFVFGSGYVGAGIAMVATIALMIGFDVVHPPAVSTSLSFALRAYNETNWILFGLALTIVTLLVGLERTALWILARYHPRDRR